MKRIFVGIPLSENFINKVFSLKVLTVLKQQGVKFVEPKNLHITLIPPWQEENVENVIGSLEKILSTNFNISFNEIKLGPNDREPKMLWMAGDTPREILDLRLKVYDALGQKSEERPFRLHVTLARFKNFKNIQNIKTKLNFQIPADKFVLYESHLLPQGVTYEVLGEFKLS